VRDAIQLSELTQLAKAMAAARDETARLQVAVDRAVSLVNGCDHAGFTLNHKGGLVTWVSSDDLVRRANELQQELGQGPCLDVLRDQDTLVSADLAEERRWPAWASQVHRELRVRSMMSLLVFTDTHAFGALSLYAHEGHRFDADDLAMGQALADQLSVVMAAEREIDQLGLALRSRTVIGQAQGVLMARLDIGAGQAFDYLRRVSSCSNRKLVDVAEEIARTRTVPGTD
jgi:GAF domain-containing protein